MQVSLAQIGPLQVDLTQVGLAQVSLDQDSLAQDSPAQVGPFVALGNSSSAQIRPALMASNQPTCCSLSRVISPCLPRYILYRCPRRRLYAE